MTPQPHCDHECVCPAVSGVMRSRNDVCEVYACPNDTRSRPATSPTPYDHDVIGEFCKTARAEAAAQARKDLFTLEENEHMVVAIKAQEGWSDCEICKKVIDTLESLRTEGGDE